VKQFDLNIERVLEHWTVAYAIREIMANALDERALTATPEPTITKDAQGTWHIRDYGRGIRYQHLTQSENEEKLRRPSEVIGKFGVGLKDALATFDRHNIGVHIRSRYGDITISKVPKHGFNDVRTLHALISEPSDPHLQGTDVGLTRVTDGDIENAKSFFLQYSGDEVLDTTQYGAVLRPDGKTARIYVNGLLVAEEENFLFSYNVTSLTAPLRKALNRERSNVGRGAYSDRVKTILLASSAPAVAEALAGELSRFEEGDAHDEVQQWIDVQLHACKILNATSKVVFVTSEQMYLDGKLIDYAGADGYRIIVVPRSLATKLPNLQDISGQPVRNLDVFYQEWEDSFAFQFVDPADLNLSERNVFQHTEAISALLGKKCPRIKRILISETMRVDRSGYEAAGLWQPSDRSIIIKRDQLKNLRLYSGTLLHELAHAATGTDDKTIEFEDALTEFLGTVAEVAITS
jgi:hypothetical protein